ncbi:PilZ domain-containing protein [Fulvimonas sp. R45]|uniref:PilZ domain-containing protein n=1 Tax=Fulvimonas sp. R45 TaxID=3045937 RepID=UPI00265F1723|nr:PilZ domain-containing protein [Fulvimonas sp. R45]MDO1527382.1 PilZ domain-containing protein [Fulvimonas sp. R45]
MNPAVARQGIISLKFKDTYALYGAYMPFLKQGGLFAATTQSYALGDEVVLLVNLESAGERLSVAGKVAWVTPPSAQGNGRVAGIGVQFNESPDGEAARSRIEALLAGLLGSERPTLTM